MASPKVIRAAAVQAEPVWFDLQATVHKTCLLIAQAAAAGAEIIACPECWIPGYPIWIWTPSRTMDIDMTIKYTKNCLVLDSDEIREIQASAAEHHIVVCLDHAEKKGSSLYISQCTINSEGEIVTVRRKMKPYGVERLLFGDGDAPSLNNVEATSVGRVGQLACGEHFNPQLNFSTYSQEEEIHCAAWPTVCPHPGGDSPLSMSVEGITCLARTFAIQAQNFVLSSTMILTDE